MVGTCYPFGGAPGAANLPAGHWIRLSFLGTLSLFRVVFFLKCCAHFRHFQDFRIFRPMCDFFLADSVSAPAVIHPASERAQKDGQDAPVAFLIGRQLVINMVCPRRERVVLQCFCDEFSIPTAHSFACDC